MPHVSALVAVKPTTSLARDAIVNTLHFEVDSAFGTLGTDWDNLATDLAAIYSTLGSNLMPTGAGEARVKLYDFADDTPRPVKAEKAAPITGSGSEGPREVALCMSFRAERNLPRHRGRVYLGPIRSTLLGTRPPSSINPALTNFANALSGLGGVNVQWSIWSRMDQELRTVRAWWVDDEWDTVRSRGLKATTRVSGNVTG